MSASPRPPIAFGPRALPAAASIASILLLACQSPGGAAPPPLATVASAPAATAAAPLATPNPGAGTFVVEGFVAKVYTCPPCPPGAMCKPCMGDNVVLSDAPAPIADYAGLGARDLIVFVPSRADLDRLAVGRRVRLTVRARGTKTTSRPMNDLELLAIDAAP